jgi:hypothetical protein
MQVTERNEEGVHDLTDLTCTNLMIRLKILLKKLPPKETLLFIVRRDQRETIEDPFSRDGYLVQVERIDRNRFHVRMKKKETGDLP